MSTKKIMAFAVVLMFGLSAVAFAAPPWLSVTQPNPQKIWDKSTETMVTNNDPLTVWQSGQKYMVVWDSAGLDGNVRVDLMKAGVIVATVSPAGGVPIGIAGKGFLESTIYATDGPGEYQIRVSSVETPGISSISEPVSIQVEPQRNDRQR